MLPPTFIPAKPRRRRKRSHTSAVSTAALTLVAATYDGFAPSLRLTFDRAIDIPGFVATEIIVDDGVFGGSKYQGLSGTLIDPTTIEVSLLDIDAWVSTDVRLTAGAGNGIVAVDDGNAWAGVINLLVPFP
jgi:hypothetical protein